MFYGGCLEKELRNPGFTVTTIMDADTFVLKKKSIKAELHPFLKALL